MFSLAVWDGCTFMTLDANLGYVNPPRLMDSEQEQYIHVY